MNFKLDERYAKLTHKQQAWLDAFAIFNDVTKATLEAYTFKDPEAARAYGLTVMANLTIAGLIRDYLTPKPIAKLPTQEELRAMYIEIFNDPNEHSRVRLQALTAYERVSGFNKTVPKDNGAFDPLDDITG